MPAAAELEFTGVEALVHELAKVGILQRGCHSFFVVQLFIDCKEKDGLKAWL